MKYGLTIEDIQSIQGVMVKFPQVEKLILYGSRAKGNYRPNSDIDLCLIGQNIDLGLQIQIENALDDLLLPYKIDLSVFHEIENPELLEHINRIGIHFFEREQEQKNC